VGYGVLSAAELVGASPGAGPAGVNSDSSTEAQSEDVPEMRHSYTFLMLLIDSSSAAVKIEDESKMLKEIQKVQAPLLCLISEADLGASTESAKDALIAGLERGMSPDYTVRIVRSGEQDSLRPFIDRWLRARF
jgi:hypothetical protein